MGFARELRDDSSQGRGQAGVLIDLDAGSSSEQGWFSSVNSSQNAEYARSFDIGDNGQDGGRIIDAVAQGGPNMDWLQYPATDGWPVSVAELSGILSPVAVGYTKVSSGTYAVGVGSVREIPGGCPGLGALPVVEGQINTADMDPGTYVLHLMPKKANIIPGDSGFDCDAATITPFATAVNERIGDTINFELVEP
jgi:hypothetical protein